mgnify:CR=1 FL=1
MLRCTIALAALSMWLLMAAPAYAQQGPVGSSDDAGAAEEEGLPPNYGAKLRKMEEDVVSLKERIYATKTRLVLLKERILSDVVNGAYAIVVHKNDMGAAFTLDQVMYYIDGKKKLFLRNKAGNLDKERQIEVFSGSVSPGNHVISVEMVYKGTGSVFTYLDGYKFKITSKYTFYASEGRIVKIQSVGYEKGDFTYSLEERPAIKFEVAQYKFNPENLAKLTGKNKDDD